MHLPERTITTGVGEVAIQVPKVRDRSGSGVKFNSMLLPPCLKRASSVEELLPWLYLKGVSTGDFGEALSALLGAEAKGVSPATISRLKAKWSDEHQDWQQRSLRQQRYVYIWADGNHTINTGLVICYLGKLKALSQVELLGQAIFEMTVGRLYRPILVGNAPIIAGGLQSIVLAQVFIELGELFVVAPRVAVGRTQTVGAFALAERSSAAGGL